jgi:hypothetical protein
MRLPPTPTIGQLCERGVWTLACIGPRDEFILFAVDSERRYLPESFTMVPPNSDFESVVEMLWDRLDAADPVSEDAAQDQRRKQLRVVR